MTDYTTLTRMAPAAVVDMARSLCALLAEGTAGDGELTTGLVPIGSAPGTAPTWFITDGPIDVLMAGLMLDPDAMFAYCEAIGLPVTLDECQALLGACIVRAEPGLAVMAEMGLELAVAAEAA